MGDDHPGDGGSGWQEAALAPQAGLQVHCLEQSLLAPAHLKGLEGSPNMGQWHMLADDCTHIAPAHLGSSRARIHLHWLSDWLWQPHCQASMGSSISMG